MFTVKLVANPDASLRTRNRIAEHENLRPLLLDNIIGAQVLERDITFNGVVKPSRLFICGDDECAWIGWLPLFEFEYSFSPKD